MFKIFFFFTKNLYEVFNSNTDCLRERLKRGNTTNSDFSAMDDQNRSTAGLDQIFSTADDDSKDIINKNFEKFRHIFEIFQSIVFDQYISFRTQKTTLNAIRRIKIDNRARS